jgi:glutamate 5-kinase
LLGLHCVPVINENDSVATAEIRYGDNDRLAARVAEMMQADVLILLSDIDGLYTADPRKNPEAAHIPVVAAMTPEIDAMGGEPPPGYSSGGMRTKLVAARIATQAGSAMAIALGHRQNPIRAITEGAKCTWFLPAPEGRTARKNWIAGHLAPLGAITIDAGAKRALLKGSSLLPAGIKSITGEFERGDAIDVLSLAGERIGRGLAAYSSADAAVIAGHRSEDFESLLGWRGRDEVIHRDDLVIF